jgi:type IV secretion system protein VirB9
MADAQPQRVARAETAIDILSRANGAARQSPRRDGFVEARHVYSYKPGAIYELYANPAYVSTILLEPGETLGDIAAGDTARWMVTETQGETDGDPRTIVLVKPSATGLRTNIVLVTDRRTYLIEAAAQAGPYSAQIAWRYPETDSPPRATPLDALDFGYRVRTVRGRRPVWQPARVFDDGRRTWIEFEVRANARDLPPLFVVTPDGAELVNYRVIETPSGRRYQVDRLFDAAELRLGARAPVVVRIERVRAIPTPSPRRAGRP